MTSTELRLALLPALLALACGSSSSGGGGGGSGGAGDTPNVLPISVDGPGCRPTFLNKPCVSVTVCTPGTSTCQTVGDILLDTGSIGLRLFSQALQVSLPNLTVEGQSVGECISYVDGSSDWGPVVQADVVLGQEPAVRLPIQVIDATFSVLPSSCTNPDRDPGTAGFNGILGVGPFAEDCGEGCSVADNGLYFACGTSCAGVGLPNASQVQNPVARQPVDGNGLIVRLPAVPASGAASVAGELILGIGTRSNNAPPASVLAFPLDLAGEFRTTLGDATEAAFVDTGSNGLFFAAPAGTDLPACAPPNAVWYCPAATTSVQATNSGASGSPSAPLTFQVSNFDALDPSVNVSAQVGGPLPSGAGVDWGLPFHLGRDVYLGFDGRSSTLGNGPLVGY